MSLTRNDSRAFLAKAFAILLLGFALRVWALGGASLWVDEVTTDDWVRLPVPRILALVLGDIVHMPLYFVLLHFFPTRGELLLRLPSAFAGLLAIALIMRLAHYVFRSRTAGLWAGLLLACNPLHVWLSRTARPYALLLVCALLASLGFVALLRGHRSRAAWGFFILASAATVLTHFFGLMLPLAQGLLLLVLPNQRRLFRPWLAAQIVALLPILLLLPGLIWVYTASDGEAFTMHVSWIPPARLYDPLLTLWNMACGYDGRPLSLWLVPGIAAASAGLLQGIGAALRPRGEAVARCWVLLALVPPLIVLALAPFQSLYMDRYFIVVLPAVLLLMLGGWRSLGPRGRSGLALVVALTGLGLVLPGLVRGSYHGTDWRGAAAWVEDGYRPGDALVVDDIIAFGHYFDPADLAAAPKYGLPSDPHDIHPLADLMLRPGARAWVIYSNPYSDAHRQGVLPFEPFAQGGAWMADWLIARRDQIAARRDFAGVTIFLVVG